MDLREVELRIVVAEGVVARSEAEPLGEEARRSEQSLLALLVERGRISEESRQSLLADALNDPALQPVDPSGRTQVLRGAADKPGFPVSGWDRYTNVRFLGQGGMGK